MRSVLVLVLAAALHATVSCGYTSDFSYELLTKYIEELKKDQEIIQQRLEHAELHIATLQAQLESQKPHVKKLQRKVTSLYYVDASPSSEEEDQNKKVIHTTPKQEIKPLKPIRTTYHKPLKQQDVTCQPQLDNESSNKTLSESAQLSGDYKWIPYRPLMQMPDNALFAGDETYPIYVARVSHKSGDSIVGTLYPPWQQCSIPFGGKEVYYYSECELLTGSGFSWVPYSNGTLPENAFSNGRNLNGDQLYIGRVYYYAEGLKRVEPAPGSFDDRCKIFTTSYGGKEHKYNEFDVLVMESNEIVDATTTSIDVSAEN